MNVSQNIKKILEEKNLTQKALSKHLGIATSTINNWIKLNRSIPAEYIIPICEFLDISPYLLLTGKEKSSPTEQLTADEQELITYYRKLDPKSQGVLLGRAETMAERQQSVTDNSTKDSPHITTSVIYSRSTDNIPPRTVTGDFSDILNAPDATDEY